MQQPYNSENEWHAEFKELAKQFFKYCTHTLDCELQRKGHWHHGSDGRMVCSQAPCKCGLVFILGALVPDITWSMRCPDLPEPSRYKPQPRTGSKRTVPKTD